MLYPTMTVAVLGILFVTALAAADWYVWGAAVTTGIRRPITVRPLTLRELADKFLGRVIATNAEVLPASVIAHSEAPPAAASNDGHGFKKVA
jgi:hypothetical protein